MEEISILSEQAKNEINLIRWNKYIQKELKGTSDRALVLICCAVLDTQLEELLSEFLIEGYEKQKKELFTHNGSLGTFSNKIEMAFFCGIISSHEKNIINTMRRIRNKFAHEIEILNLEEQSVKDLCMNLSIPEKMYVPDIIPYSPKGIVKFDIEPFKDGKMRTRFIETFRYITRYLERRKLSVNKQKEFEALTEIENLQCEIESLQRQMDVRNELNEEIEKIKMEAEKIAKQSYSDEITDKSLNIINSINDIQNNDKLEDYLKISPHEYIEALQRILETIKKSYEEK